ncbi:hypothetical protein [Rhizobium sp. BE258]|uniref:hypothetical protein n=1 Tax=Rhizobium sp. BE258 TaxID=2817722 RepID=UPI00285BE892|nr:hypothetical protein [Rhizobium sp. BE258]MDR7147146.1 hypothetical protein [Rhizobium sp. BE258]
MDELDVAPVVGRAEFRRLAEIHGCPEAEEIPTEPLKLSDGRLLLRSRPGRWFLKDANGVVVAVANPDLA